MKNKAPLFLIAGIALLGLSGDAFPLKPVIVIDGYEPGSQDTVGKANIFERLPSKISSVRGISGAAVGRGCLALTYDKKDQGGPYNSGGWCGYYHVLGAEPRWFDATGYVNITFWARGQTGNETFKIGVADKEMAKIGDSYKSRPVGSYIPKGLSTQWNKVTIPLREFPINPKQFASITYCIEGDGEMQGRVFIDELTLE